MACYYRRIGKLRTALNFLQQALALETKIERSQTLADTHLNICAVYSQLGTDLRCFVFLTEILLYQENMTLLKNIFCNQLCSYKKNFSQQQCQRRLIMKNQKLNHKKTGLNLKQKICKTDLLFLQLHIITLVSNMSSSRRFDSHSVYHS